MAWIFALKLKWAFLLSWKHRRSNNSTSSLLLPSGQTQSQWNPLETIACDPISPGLLSQSHSFPFDCKRPNVFVFETTFPIRKIDCAAEWVHLSLSPSIPLAAAHSGNPLFAGGERCISSIFAFPLWMCASRIGRRPKGACCSSPSFESRSTWCFPPTQLYRPASGRQRAGAVFAPL